VSQRRFQALMARLVIDPLFRDRVRQQGEGALGDDLTAVEKRRLSAVSRSRGVEMTRTLHKGWRLGKVLTMLPLIHLVLGDDLLARELSDFWQKQPPRTLYFRDEAIAFCDHLKSSDVGRESPFLEEVVDYERAKLELFKPWPHGEKPPQVVRFRHDPVQLLNELAAGRRPPDLPENPCVVAGSVDADGRIRWTLVEGKPSYGTVDHAKAPSEPLTARPSSDGLAQH
jgi:hypothetical protein